MTRANFNRNIIPEGPSVSDRNWLDSEEAERKTARKMTVQKVQHVATDQFRKNDKFTKKAKETDNTSRQTLHQEVEQDETEAEIDGDDNGFVSIRDKEQNVVQADSSKLFKTLLESSAETSQDRVPDAQNGAGVHAERIVRGLPFLSENCLLTFCGVLFTS
jgi:hypothetical protein